MDPVTIFQIVGTVVSLGDVVIKCIARLSTLKAQFHDAPIIVTSMIGQLHMVKIAQDQLSILNSPAFTNHPRYHQLAAHIGNALDSFSPILLALGQQLDRYERGGADRMAAKTRLGFLNGEREMTNLSILLDRQVNALNLLLQAIQCTTWTQQSEVITRGESQSILRLAQDCSSSLLGLNDVASFISENTGAISTRFEFDDVLRSTLLYQTAERSHLRQAIRARRTRNAERISTDNLSQRSVTFGFRQAFRAMKLTKPIEETDILENQQTIRVHIQRGMTVEAPGDNSSMRPKDPVQEDPVNGNEKPTQLPPGSSNSSSTQPQPGLGNWRKAFQRRTSRASEIKTHQDQPTDQAIDDPQPSEFKVLLLGASGGGKTTLLHALHLFAELRVNRESEKPLELRTAQQFRDNSYYDRKTISRSELLQNQVTTIGIHQTVLRYNGIQYLLHDVGGERSERRKWICAFEDVSTIIYPVETIGYGKVLREEMSGDRMREQFSIWKSVVNSHWFTDSNFVIVLTKMDLLGKYLENRDVRGFLEREGVPATVEDYLGYLEVSFLELIQWPENREERVRERVRFVRANLVDTQTDNATIDVMNALESLNKQGKSEFGKHTPLARHLLPYGAIQRDEDLKLMRALRHPGVEEAVTPGDRNMKLSEKSTISPSNVDRLSETSSSDVARLSVRGSEDTNALLFGMEQYN
ncbi:G-protein alpha subunit-domain-containing protein [Xylaria arbuscula]|nr:G-protein alpha subunit-domain-containing protein [Xylaria arbuscula]